MEALRIVQTSPTGYVVQRQVEHGSLWWRRLEWKEVKEFSMAGTTIIRGYGALTGGMVRKIFPSVEAAEEWIEERREMQNYPKLVKEVTI